MEDKRTGSCRGLQFLDFTDINDDGEADWLRKLLTNFPDELHLPWSTECLQVPPEECPLYANGQVEVNALTDDVDETPTCNGNGLSVLVNNDDNEKEEEVEEQQRHETSQVHNDNTSVKAAWSINTNKSFASLFYKTANCSVSSNLNSCVEQQPPTVAIATNSIASSIKANYVEDVKQPTVKYVNDSLAFMVGEVSTDYKVECKTVCVTPRGLINRSNYCYINSILQVLLACPPFYNLLSQVLGRQGHTARDSSPKNDVNCGVSLPVIDGLCRFLQKFQPLIVPATLQQQSRQQRRSDVVPLNCDHAFEPNWFYKLLNDPNDSSRGELFQNDGRQQDAEEFLSFLLNECNDEMLAALQTYKEADLNSDNNKNGIQKSIQQHPQMMNGGENNDEDDWRVMGARNKGTITRNTHLVRTPITEIFGGCLRSKIHRTGDEVTNNIQPFFSLQLNIEKVSSVHEAIDALLCKHKLEGVISQTTNAPVEAWQQVTLEKLPIILVLHLKCFDFRVDGCRKIVKALQFPINLKLDPKWISTRQSNVKERHYKLFAVVYHDGKEVTKGHYTADAFHVGYTQWIRYDDASIRFVSEEQVLHPHGDRVPYLLFYRRSDTYKSKQVVYSSAT